VAPNKTGGNNNIFDSKIYGICDYTLFDIQIAVKDIMSKNLFKGLQIS